MFVEELSSILPLVSNSGTAVGSVAGGGVAGGGVAEGGVAGEVGQRWELKDKSFDENGNNKLGEQVGEVLVAITILSWEIEELVGFESMEL